MSYICTVEALYSRHPRDRRLSEVSPFQGLKSMVFGMVKCVLFIEVPEIQWPSQVNAGQPGECRAAWGSLNNSSQTFFSSHSEVDYEYSFPYCERCPLVINTVLLPAFTCKARTIQESRLATVLYPGTLCTVQWMYVRTF